MTNDEQMPELDAAIERLKAATPKTAPWTVWDFSDSGEVPIDKEIAIILNAVVSGELTRADLCASGKRVRAVLEGAVNWLDALLTLVQETSCDPDDPEAFDEVVMAAGMWLSSARAALTPAPDAPQPAGEAEPVDLSHGWLIHKAGRGWYRPNAKGYTGCIAEAGRYSHEDALAYSHPNGLDGPRDNITIKHESEVARPPRPSASVVEAIAACETVLICAQEMCKAGHPVSAFNVATDALRALKGDA